MAANGGTGAPIYPQNKDELVSALTQIFGQIREQASSFASAAVPTVQTEVADKIYISNFTPLNGAVDLERPHRRLPQAPAPERRRPAGPRPQLPGHRHSHQSAQRLPSLGRRDTDAQPGADGERPGDRHEPRCERAPHRPLGASQRRVFYAKADPGTGAVPRAARIFAPPPGAPASDADWLDLFQGLKLTPAPVTGAERTAAAVDVKDIMKETLVIKSSTIQNGTATPIPVDYVLGDTFHADPTIVDRPNDFDRYAAQLYKNTLACADAGGVPQNPSYKCWADKHKRRRKMLAIAANDGQLHFFDAGIYRPSATPPAFDDGTGYELFSYMPRLALPIVRAEATGSNHIYARGQHAARPGGVHRPLPQRHADRGGPPMADGRDRRLPRGRPADGRRPDGRLRQRLLRAGHHPARHGSTPAATRRQALCRAA